MHELSIALGIVKIAEEACQKKGALKVDVIELQIGELAGIESASLEFAWPLAVKDTKLEHAEKVIDWVKGEAECIDCGQQFTLSALYDHCPCCNSHFKAIKAGKELRVKSLIVS